MGPIHFGWYGYTLCGTDPRSYIRATPAGHSLSFEYDQLTCGSCQQTLLNRDAMPPRLPEMMNFHEWYWEAERDSTSHWDVRRRLDV